METIINPQGISQEILTQLGGNKFIVMTGCKNFAFDEEGTLSFKLPGMVRKIATHVKIKLNSLDTYDMIFLKAKRDYSFVTVAEHNGIYNDMLRKCFTETTGLCLTL